MAAVAPEDDSRQASIGVKRSTLPRELASEELPGAPRCGERETAAKWKC